MTTTKYGKPATKIALEPFIADRLLDLLGTDNSFRRSFRKDPANALLQIGYVPATQDVAAELGYLRTSLTVERLASKERITQSRDEIRRMLTQGLAMIPIQLNVASSSNFVARGSFTLATPKLRMHSTFMQSQAQFA
ncbi:hypothetical protein D3C71_1406350 [compost metagenome]